VRSASFSIVCISPLGELVLEYAGLYAGHSHREFVTVQLKLGCVLLCILLITPGLFFFFSARPMFIHIYV